MTRNSILLAILVVAAAALPATAVAQSGGSDSGIVSVDISDVGTLEKVQAAVAGFVAKIADAVGDRVAAIRGNGPDATAEADELAAEIQNNRAAYKQHLNGFDQEYDVTFYDRTEVLRVDITDSDGGNESVYFRVSSDGSNITAVNASRTSDWTVTRTHQMTAGQAEDLNEDLDAYREEYVSTDTYPSPTYFIQKGSRYGNISEVKSD